MTAHKLSKQDKYKNPNLLYEDDDFYLWWTIITTKRAISRVRDEELLRYRITGAESSVLFALKIIGDSPTPSIISRFLIRTAHSTWGLLGRMEKKGLIRRIKDTKKKNLLRISLTDKGNMVYKAVSPRPSLHKIFDVLSEEDRQQLKNCLSKLKASARANL